MDADHESSGNASDMSGQSIAVSSEDEFSSLNPTTLSLPANSTAETVAENSTTLKQVYGMLCWLLIDGNCGWWRAAPLEASRQAIQQCPHLTGADAQQLEAKMAGIARRREQLIQEYGTAEAVPRETRVFAGGPLFVIVDYALAGRTTQVPADEIYALLQIHGVGKCADKASSAGGPIRHTPQRKSPTSQRRLSPEHPLMQRARKLTPAEVKQMQSEMAIRREIALRDAKLLADWTALKRRELEVKELKIREFIRAQEDGTLDSLVKFEEYLKQLQDSL
ncbi:hypothetical protein H4S02_001132 [Coemansia sp. RSA 2611]|nr:hypothetical protein H4S02_001132 [Coemansia sp. RSA 2611]